MTDKDRLLRSGLKKTQKRAKSTRTHAEHVVEHPDTNRLVQRSLHHPFQVTSAEVKQLQRTLGNRAAQSLLKQSTQRKEVGAVQVSSKTGSPVIQRAGSKTPSWIEGFKRKMRILKRILDKKSLPPKVYRLDARPPEKISYEGFQPWKPEGQISIEEHVNNVLKNSGGKLAKYDSQFVSTAGYKGLADATLAQICGGKFIYKVDTKFAGMDKSNSADVNDYFDRLGQRRPYSTQREWIKSGGIPGAAIEEYLPAGDFYKNQVKYKTKPLRLQLPKESDIKGWRPLPRINLLQVGKIKGDYKQTGTWS
jgi:hypothetical protein